MKNVPFDFPNLLPNSFAILIKETFSLKVLLSYTA